MGIREDAREFIDNVIDSWISSYDDDYDSMSQAHDDLDSAEDYFEGEKYDEFLEEYGYEDTPEVRENFFEVLANSIDETRDYLSDTYDHYDDTYEE